MTPTFLILLTLSAIAYALHLNRAARAQLDPVVRLVREEQDREFRRWAEMRRGAGLRSRGVA